MSDEYSEYNIGGRSVDDVTQLAYSLRQIVKDEWPINRVPDKVAREIEAIVNHSETLATRMRDIIKIVNQQRVSL